MIAYFTPRTTGLTRLLAKVAVFGALAFLGAAALPAQAQPAGPPSHVQRLFGYITTRDGTQLAYAAYLPAAQGKFPTIFDYDPYAGGGTGNDRFPQGGFPPSVRWVKAGYAFIYVSVRGTGCSQGAFDQFGPHEGPDGADVIDWIGRQGWSDQKVGMTGGSYPGHTQILVAAEHPKWLRAISPSAITMSTYNDISVPGGVLNVGFASRWNYMIHGGAEKYGAFNRISWGDKQCISNMAAHPKLNPFTVAMAHPFYDDYWKTRSLETYVDRVEVPTFISQAWQDNETSIVGATELYDHLHAPKWLNLSNGGHDWTALQDALQVRLVRWMDHWVKGVDNGAEQDPRVTVYWEIPKGRPVVAKWTTQYKDWPVAGAAPKTLYLTADGALNASAPAGGDSRSQSYTFGPGVELIGDNAQFSLAPDETGSLAWTSGPLAEDMTILGSAQVHLFASSDNVDTDFVVTLHDIYPNGDVEYLQRGVLRASMRQVDEARSTPERVRHPFDKSEPLEPGKVYDIRLSLPPLGAVLRKGHRLQVTVTAPSAIPQPDWGLQPLNLPGRNTIYASSAYPSRIVVPVISGAAAPAPEPTCGSMPFMPCRQAAP